MRFEHIDMQIDQALQHQIADTENIGVDPNLEVLILR